MNFGSRLFNTGFRYFSKPACKVLPKVKFSTRTLKLQNTEHLRVTQLLLSQNILALQNLTRMLEKASTVQNKCEITLNDQDIGLELLSGYVQNKYSVCKCISCVRQHDSTDFSGSYVG